MRGRPFLMALHPRALPWQGSPQVHEEPGVLPHGRPALPPVRSGFAREALEDPGCHSTRTQPEQQEPQSDCVAHSKASSGTYHSPARTRERDRRPPMAPHSLGRSRFHEIHLQSVRVSLVASCSKFGSQSESPCGGLVVGNESYAHIVARNLKFPFLAIDGCHAVAT